MKKNFGNLRGLFWISDYLYAKEVCSDTEREWFLQTIEKGYLSIFQKSQDPSKGRYTDFMGRIRREFEGNAWRSMTVVVMDVRQGVPVGCVRLVGGGPGHGGKLPMESCIPFNLDELGRYAGHIAEVGRFVILADGVARAKVLELMISLIIVRALRSGVRVILTDAIEANVTLYEKMGLHRIAGPFTDTEFSQAAYLCAADVASLMGPTASSAWSRVKASPRAQKTISSYLERLKRTNDRRRILHRPVLDVGQDLGPLVGG